jgi:PhzF family phenazine biosynthesis protein
VVDAFASGPFTGNPAAVVFDADGLDDDAMRALAGEFNLSETTFILKPSAPGADVRFRWFTPTVEVHMCGHATLAGLHALAEAGQLIKLKTDPKAEVRIQTAGGELTGGVRVITPESGACLAWVQLPTARLKRREFNTDKLAALLRTSAEAWNRSAPTVVTQDDDLIIVIRELQLLNELRPDFAELADWCLRQQLRGILVTTTNTLMPGIDAHSRFFAPAAGVDEDPVTGSAHGPLGAYLVSQKLVNVDRDGIAALCCMQAKPGGRAGFVQMRVVPRPYGGHDVDISGACLTTMRGILTI